MMKRMEYKKGTCHGDLASSITFGIAEHSPEDAGDKVKTSLCIFGSDTKGREDPSHIQESCKEA